MKNIFVWLLAAACFAGCTASKPDGPVQCAAIQW